MCTFDVHDHAPSPIFCFFVSYLNWRGGIFWYEVALNWAAMWHLHWPVGLSVAVAMSIGILALPFSHLACPLFGLWWPFLVSLCASAGRFIDLSCMLYMLLLGKCPECLFDSHFALISLFQSSQSCLCFSHRDVIGFVYDVASTSLVCGFFVFVYFYICLLIS